MYKVIYSVTILFNYGFFLKNVIIILKETHTVTVHLHFPFCVKKNYINNISKQNNMSFHSFLFLFTYCWGWNLPEQPSVLLLAIGIGRSRVHLPRSAAGPSGSPSGWPGPKASWSWVWWTWYWAGSWMLYCAGLFLHVCLWLCCKCEKISEKN